MLILNDYAVIALDDKKPHLVKVVKASKERYKGVLAALLPYETEMMDFFKDDVLANLGQMPKTGKAYGIKIEPFMRTAHLPNWGEVHYFDKLLKKTRVEINEEFERVHRRLLKRKLFLDEPLKTEIRPKAGKYAGSYKYSGGDKEDILTLHPKEWTDLGYIITHEYGHRVWFRLMSNKQKASWITLYHLIVTHKAVTSEKIAKLRRQLVKSNETVSKFAGQLDEEVKPIFIQCIKHIKEKHNLLSSHLNTILQEGDELKQYWPASTLELKELKTDITEYATKSPEEFFAEAFAFHLVGKKLPKYIVAHLEKTLIQVAR